MNQYFVRTACSISDHRMNEKKTLLLPGDMIFADHVISDRKIPISKTWEIYNMETREFIGYHKNILEIATKWKQENL